MSGINWIQASGVALTDWPRLPSRWSGACAGPSSASTPPPAGWSSASAQSGTCCSHFSLSSDTDPPPFPVCTPTRDTAQISCNPGAQVPCTGKAQAEAGEKNAPNLKLGLAVRSVLVPLEGRAHQIVEARVPEVGHDVVAPSKRVQLVLLHGGQDLGKRLQRCRQEIQMCKVLNLIQKKVKCSIYLLVILCL